MSTGLRQLGSVEKNNRVDRMANELTALSTIFAEFYYWVTVVFMFLIHVGFCIYAMDTFFIKCRIFTKVL